MHPILFELPGGFPLRSFGLMVVLGFLLGSHLYGRLGRRYSADPEATAAGYASVPLWILGGILLGARGMYVIVEVLQG
ncbi:MAG: prolipoprotein diacylglyceryl transferase family protein, partial [Planctomycetota bacterium]|nr:prolipoprotein diacylglyceryl transferase family protein [Planctomycetota bacterium]